jgi:hypothetical protein
MQMPQLQQPLQWCKKLQTAWRELLEEHKELKDKFESIPDPKSYYFYIVFTIDSSGKLTINDADKFSPGTSKSDSLCFKLLYGELEQTKWQPAYILNKDESKSAASMEGHVFITITSKGFQSIDVIKRINCPSFSTIPYDDKVFYSCTCGQ